MARVQIIGAPYSSKSVIASGQECVNLYAEINDGDPQSPAAVTYYPTPGTKLYSDPQFVKNARGCYRTSIGTAYYIVGQNVYFLTNNGILNIVGVIADRQSQVYFSDNGIVCVLVDGVNGYVIDLITNQFGIITDPNFYGADYIALLDTFFIFNRPATNQFYLSGSNVNFTMLTTTGAFDPLDIAAKSGFNDPIVGIVAVHRELWLVGALTTEIWIGTGAADFYFQEVQGSYVNHGCGAQYSIATQDVLLFFLMQDQQGKNLVVQGMGYDVTEISTPRVVSELNKYETTADAIGFCFQIEDHSYYALVFPTANKGWLYDLKTKWWYEWNWCDQNGNLNRPRANCCMFVNGKNLIGDWENGLLLQLDINTFTDYTPAAPVSPIVRIRTFAHSVDNNQKISYKSFDADMQVGTANEEDAPTVDLSWSDNKGVSYNDPVSQSMGKIGEFMLVPSWNRLGEARDRVFKLQWSTNNATSLNGAFVDVKAARN